MPRLTRESFSFGAFDRAVSTDDLIVFLKTSKAALASSDSVLVVKENLCPDLPADGVKGSVVFDDEDSSLTRCVPSPPPPTPTLPPFLLA